jgi:DHA2 family multidrug resistance protein
LLLTVGLSVNAYALYYMAGFNLHIDFHTAAMGRVIQGLGMPFFFVPLTYLTMAHLPREQMNNASAIFNLLRNMGGSFGVAFVTTLVARRAQLHQHHLAERLSPFDPGLTLRLNELKSTLGLKLGTFADQSQHAGEMIYGALVREATSLAFNDAFYVQALLFLGLLGVLWIVRRPPTGRRPAPGGH